MSADESKRGFPAVATRLIFADTILSMVAFALAWRLSLTDESIAGISLAVWLLTFLSASVGTVYVLVRDRRLPATLTLAAGFLAAQLVFLTVAATVTACGL